MKNILSQWAQTLAFLGGKKKVEKSDSITEFFHSEQKIGKVKTIKFFIEGGNTPIHTVFKFPEDRIEIH